MILSMSHTPAPINLKSPFAASAISGHLDTRTAATEVADILFNELGSPAGESNQSLCDLALIFGSFHHRSAFEDAAEIIRKAISPQVLLGVTAEAVIGTDRELEGVAGLSAIALRLPGARLQPWHSTPEDPIPLRDPQKIRARIGVELAARDFKTAIMFGDPFSTPITRLLPAITSCGKVQSPKVQSPNAQGDTSGQNLDFDDLDFGLCPVPVIGGMASGASQPGVNVLVLNDRSFNAGAIGVSIAGGFEIEFIVSQGCRPIGKPFVITKCKDNVILELGGRKAIEALQEMGQELSDAERRLLSRGLLLGTVINEYKDHFGRGDFLVRNVMGLDQRAGGIIAGEFCRVGQTVQFHARDAATAAEDLQLLLDAQVLNPTPPFAALMFSCNGRGERLFGEPDHDLNIIRQRFGENLPIAGFFAAGEFGPIGDRSFLHGHTVSLALLRAPVSGSLP